MRRYVWFFHCLLAATAGCSRTLTSGDRDDPTPVHGVDVVATVTGHGADGESVTIKITNTGDADAFLSRCGSGPLLLVQRFVDGEWTGGIQNFACPAPSEPGPVRLGSTVSITIVRVFGEAGHLRVRVPVATTQELSDVSQAVSNGFDVR
jgi:hypothetical protein